MKALMRGGEGCGVEMVWKRMYVARERYACMEGDTSSWEGHCFEKG